MRRYRHHRIGILLTVAAFFICAVPVWAAQPQIEGLSPDFVMKANLRGGPFTLTGSFKVTWEEYVITGTLGEGDSVKGLLKVTRDPHVFVNNDDPLELVSDTLELQSENQRLIATGSVKVTAKDLLATSDRLEGGVPADMKAIVANALAHLPEQVRNEIDSWWDTTEEKDQIFFLQGSVKGHTPEVHFIGEMLLINSTKEVFLFAGPSQLTYKDDEGSNSEGPTENGSSQESVD